MTRSTATNGNGSWECHTFIRNGDQVSLEKHLKLTNFNTDIRFQNETLLTTAVKSGCPQIVRILLSHGADPNLRSSENGRNEPPLITATRFKRFEIVRLLVENGADIEMTGFYGHDAIFQAVVENTVDILKYLLEQLRHEKSVHQPQNCPFLHALKYSDRFANKRSCLLILLGHNYLCKNCLRRENNPNASLINTEAISSALNGGSIFKILKCNDKELEPTILFFIRPLRLVNLAREAIRKTVCSTALTFTDGINYTSSIKKLTLPSRLTNFLLYNDIEDITVRLLRLHPDGCSICKIYLIYF